MISSAIKLCRLLVSRLTQLYIQRSKYICLFYVHSWFHSWFYTSSRTCKNSKKENVKRKMRRTDVSQQSLQTHLMHKDELTYIITFIVPWLLAATTTLDPCLKQNRRWQVILRKVLQYGPRNCKILTWVNSLFLHIFWHWKIFYNFLWCLPFN